MATSGGRLFTGSLAAHDDGLESLQQATQMPGFDPVRDAVLNSPVTRSPTIPRHHPPPSTSAATSPNNASAPTAQAPRRATVAALLNDISPSPSSSIHPPSLPVSASSLAHILHPNPPDDPPRFPSPVRTPADSHDSQDLLNLSYFPELSAQLDTWTNLAFESDEPLVHSGSSPPNTVYPPPQSVMSGGPPPNTQGWSYRGCFTLV